MVPYSYTVLLCFPEYQVYTMVPDSFWYAFQSTMYVLITNMCIHMLVMYQQSRSQIYTRF